MKNPLSIANPYNKRFLAKQLGIILFAMSSTSIAGTVAQTPLFLTSTESPNVLINLSVEGPMGGAAYADQPTNPDGCTGRQSITLSSVTSSNLGTCYFPNTEYLGYFDPNKCYTYVLNSTTPADSYFSPGKPVINAQHQCTTRSFTDGRWSGNFLNWLTMTSIDEFIWTLTGGYRTRDTTALTVVRRARSHEGWFPVKLLSTSLTSNPINPNTVTPFTNTSLFFDASPPTVSGGGRTGGYILNVGSTFANATSFMSSNGGTEAGLASAPPVNRKYFISVRLCQDAATKENNCKAYSTNATPPVVYYKPEGLIQKDAMTKRFALTSYLSDNASNRQGGVLRTNMKYVGPVMPDATGAIVNNPLKEFGTDGLLINNPESRTSVNSGIINYLNRFSEPGYKSFDPVSELFYESIRYYKNIGATPENYSGVSQGADSKNGGFWFNTSSQWQNPIQYYCQKNFILAINDAYPWLDKRLPGTAFTNQTINTTTVGTTYDLNNPWSFGSQSYSPTADFGQPSNPDPAINVKSLTDSVGVMENNRTYQTAYTFKLSELRVGGGNGNHAVGHGMCTRKNLSSAGLGSVMATCSATDSDSTQAHRDNTYYVAGLAWYANTNDLRADLPGMQTVSTFMIDTQEYNSSPNIGPTNMLWLAGKYGGFNDLNNDKNPNTTLSGEPANEEWDANNDGEPDNYVFASKPARMVDSLTNAFLQIDKESASASSAAANTTRLQTDALLFRGVFSSANWTGDMLAFRLGSEDANGNGTLDTGEDSNGNNVLDEGIISNVPLWKASENIPSENSRNIFSYNPQLNTANKGIIFEWANLNKTQKAVLDPASVAASATTSPIVDYLRGDQSKENPLLANRLRKRQSLLGDIINSDPLFISNEDLGYGVLPNPEGSKYSQFLTNKLSRSDMIYVGANDGMLHAINAEPNAGVGGDEKFAYIPNSVISAELTTLTTPYYAHKYFVDGSPQGGDVFFGGNWHTVVIGTMGGGATTEEKNADLNNDGNTSDQDLPTGTGGKGVFALDVTNPDTFSVNNVLWEFTSRNDPDLGYTIPQPSMVRMANGKWAAIVANGYDSSTGKAVLFIIDIETGGIIQKIVADKNIATNGLSSPLPVDVNNDKITDFIYAGDLNGNMWKFDVSSPTASQWKVAFSPAGCGANPTSNCVPLYVACAKNELNASNNAGSCATADRQPITSKPNANLAHFTGQENGGVMVYFGTGKYFELGDHIVGATPQIQSFYGIWDQCDEIYPATCVYSYVQGRTVLQKQSIIKEQTASFTNEASQSFTEDIRVTTRCDVAYGTTTPNTTSSPCNSVNNRRGWYMDFISPGASFGNGERLVSQPLLSGDGLVFATVVPLNVPCEPGGTGWLFAINQNGASFNNSSIDFNRDNKINVSDRAGSTASGDVGSGMKSKEGVLFKPSIIEGSTGNTNTKMKHAYLPGSDVSEENPSGGQKYGVCLSEEGCDPGDDEDDFGPKGFKRKSWRQVK